MASFLISGGTPLSGSIEVDGSKNAALPILSATVLVPGVSVLHNIPELRDVELTINILKELGCKVKREGTSVIVDAVNIRSSSVPDNLARELRSSITFLGALIGRVGSASMSYPGGYVKNLTHIVSIQMFKYEASGRRKMTLIKVLWSCGDHAISGVKN